MKSLTTQKLRYNRARVAKILRVVVGIRKNPTSVLILTQNLFERIGGGESVYRGLIYDNPEIDFFFFAKSKTRPKNLPKNAFAISLSPKPVAYAINARYRFNARNLTYKVLSHQQILAAELAEQYARAIRGMDFDIIDVPEYEIVGDFLRESLERNHVRFKILTNFIHGALSVTLAMEKTSAKETIIELAKLEKQQRDNADLFFTLDSWYPRQLGLDPEKCLELSPWLFVKYESPLENSNSAIDQSKLVSFSRWELRKGIDLLPLLATLMRVENTELLFAGESNKNTDLLHTVKKLAKNRNLTTEVLESKRQEIVFNKIGMKDILIVASRFDSLNLIAFEGIAAGKLVAISRQCGAFHYLKVKHPELFFIEIDSNDLVISAVNLTAAITDFDSVKSKLKSNVEICRSIRSSGDRNQYTKILNSITSYTPDPKTCLNYDIDFKESNLKRRVIHTVKEVELFKAVRKVKSLKNLSWNNLKVNQKFIGLLRLIFLYFQHLPVAKKIVLKLDTDKKYIFRKPEYFLKLVEEETYSQIRQLTYAARCLRFNGYGTQLLNSDNLKSDLQSLGFSEESTALDVILKDSTGDEVSNFLENRRLKLKESPKFTFKLVSESKTRNAGTNPKITIVVSSFNAVPKIEYFLKRLSLCLEVMNGTAEILLIDANSDSPDAEFAVAVGDKLGLFLRAIRVDRRISIQEAWNLGIMKAKGDYLCFLGVDETIYPNALADLAFQLDSDFSIDWVMADSIVTEVGEKAEFIQDIMKYSRQYADRSSPFLETCYVSYVSGMYRKNIHEKFGYYDSTFKGAGDTEFKSRVLPSLKVKYLDSTLGEFLNYPEERTTATEGIEIEDIRAWYIFRTPGGLRYQASLSSADFLENLGKSTLGYRKSYCTHTSTDLELASSIYKVAKSGNYNLSKSLFSELENADRQLQSMRIFLGYGRRNWHFLGIRRFLLLVKWFDVEGRKSAIKGARRMRMDNMFEQHIWYW